MLKGCYSTVLISIIFYSFSFFLFYYSPFLFFFVVLKLLYDCPRGKVSHLRRKHDGSKSSKRRNERVIPTIKITKELIAPVCSTKEKVKGPFSPSPLSRHSFRVNRLIGGYSNFYNFTSANYQV